MTAGNSPALAPAPCPLPLPLRGLSRSLAEHDPTTRQPAPQSEPTEALPMAATYAYAVIAAEVKSEQLSFLQDFNAGLMGEAINRAASQLNVVLRSLRIVPSSITAANAVDDFNWCRSAVILGAAGYYLYLATGTWQQGGDRVAAMQEQIRMLRESPQMLQSYNENASSTATARSRTNHNPGLSGDSETLGASARFLQSSMASRWRQ